MFPQPLLFVLLCPHFLPVCEGRGKALRSDTSSCRAPVKPKRTSQENGMQAHNALHSSTRQRRNSFDSVECLAPGPYRPSLPAWPSLLFLLLLMLSIWRFMQKCAAGRPPWSLSILSAGTAACHKLSYAEIVKLRLLASCLTQAILSLHFKQGWFLYGGTGGGLLIWMQYSKVRRINPCTFLPLYYVPVHPIVFQPPPLSSSWAPVYWDVSFLWQNFFSHFPSEMFGDSWPVWTLH